MSLLRSEGCGTVPAIGFQLGIEWRLTEIVGEVAERRETDTKDHLEGRLVAVAGVPESFKISVRHRAPACNNGLGEGSDGIEFWVRHRLQRPKRLDCGLVQPRLLIGDCRMACDAEAAAVRGGSCDLDHFAFGKLK